MLPRGGKAFTALVRQFQSTDEFNSQMIDYEKFIMALGYFKQFHLSDTQIKKLYNHHMQKDNKQLNYMNFAKAIAGPPNKNKMKLAKEILSNLSTKQSKVLVQKQKQRKANDDPSLKSAPIFNLPNLGSSLDMKNYLYKFLSRRLLIKNKDEFIKFYQEHQLILDMIEYCEVINPESIQSRVISIDTATDFFNF